MSDSGLVHAIFVRDEEHCIERMLKQVVPEVDKSYIMVDDRTTDNTVEILKDYGCEVKEFKFENFAKTKNTLLKWISQDDTNKWCIGIAPDESVDDGFFNMLHKMIPKINNTQCDCLRFPRKHWEDLEMKVPAEKDHIWYPDWQNRLLRIDYPRIHIVRYVHELVVGARQTFQIKDFNINHFNCYWKALLDYDWDTAENYYKELQALEIKENSKNIWPN